MRKREVDTEWTVAFKRILGDELRTTRKMRGWSRQQLHSKLLSKLGLDVSLQTLATYELGTRGVSAVRLAQLCMVLDIEIRDLLDRVLERLSASSQRGWTVDLVAASRIEDVELVPLRRWAHCRLAESEPKTVRVGLPALSALAVLCDMDMLELARRLPRLNLLVSPGGV